MSSSSCESTVEIQPIKKKYDLQKFKQSLKISFYLFMNLTLSNYKLSHSSGLCMYFLPQEGLEADEDKLVDLSRSYKVLKSLNPDWALIPIEKISYR